MEQKFDVSEKDIGIALKMIATGSAKQMRLK
jgi:hypothetical protein